MTITAVRLLVRVAGTSVGLTGESSNVAVLMEPAIVGLSPTVAGQVRAKVRAGLAITGRRGTHAGDVDVEVRLVAAATGPRGTLTAETIVSPPVSGDPMLWSEIQALTWTEFQALTWADVEGV